MTVARPLVLPWPRLVGPLLAILLAAPIACGDAEAETDGDGLGVGEGDVARGAALYRELCAACHGLAGEGGLGTPLAGWSRPEDELIHIIDETMPPQNTAVCTGACPADVAAYILGGLGGASCEGEPTSPRQLRLLTRREYNNTVRDLLFPAPLSEGAPCKADAECDLSSESCVADLCAADPCGRHTFVFDPEGASYQSVHVAGSFNNWAGTIAEGGWPLTYDAAAGVYYAKQELAEGSYTYKLVLDESTWITDPQNPNTEPDGFGGENSLLEIACDGGGAGGGPPGFEPASSFPVESRPKGYGYDNNAAAGIVTAVHVEEQLRAAREVATLALENLDALVPCDPAADAEGCARDFVTTFGRRAFRRPLSPAEVDKYAGLVIGEASFEAGVSVALQVMLASPYFLYRSEIGEDAGDGTIALTPYEVASALSYAFWGTMPDDALLDAAESGLLGSAEGIESEARRLLEDPRARALIGVFGSQWLGVEGIAGADKSAVAFPEWEPAIGAAMAEETRLLVEHAIFEGGGFDELLSADYTFVNGPLAAFYGIAGVEGDAFVQAPLPGERAGILGQGALLASFAHSDQSSPVRRGVMVRERLLCQQFGTPPPAAGGVPDVDPNATTRERFRQHSADQSCALCHTFIDELGFGFERFDGIGRYRESENGQAIDASGDLSDVEGMGSGTHAPFGTIPELAAILAGSQAVHTCFSRQVFRFTMGYLETPSDLCALQGIDQRFAAAGYDVRELLVAIVTSPNFLRRR
ncbi:MAG: DUF1592 domain-containing protein [Myxococcales bacterium]|nr:DUF1592 domain-containing protein [Myxococcales bacterium]